jgi:hypothetical protein
MIYARTFGGMKLFLVHKAYMALTLTYADTSSLQLAMGIKMSTEA